MVKHRKIAKNRISDYTSLQDSLVRRYNNSINNHNEYRSSYIFFRLKDDNVSEALKISDYSLEEDEFLRSFNLANNDTEEWVLLGLLPAKQALEFGGNNENFDLSGQDSQRLTEKIFNYTEERLLSYLAYRERSIFESQNFLYQLPVNIYLAKQLIERSIARNYINDRRFAELLTQSSLSRNKSFNEAKTSLIKKRIPPQTIHEVLDLYYSPENCGQVLDYHIDKATKKYPNKDSKKDYSRCINYLIRKGFSYHEFIAGVNSYYETTIYN